MMKGDWCIEKIGEFYHVFKMIDKNFSDSPGTYRMKITPAYFRKRKDAEEYIKQNKE